MNAPTSQLRERWSQLWVRLGADPDRVPKLNDLLHGYNAPPRAYHNLNHIQQCLAEQHALRDVCEKPNEVELAIWYHDGVYDSKRQDNEERSAEQAAEAMREAGIGSDVIERVTALILATKHTTLPAFGDAQIIVDIDLSILGRPESEFDAYEQAIRKEYGFVEDATFRAGRSAILQKFLDRSAIYGTGAMHRRYEAAARANLQRSINRLASQQA